MIKQINMTAQVITTVTQPPDSNLVIKVIHKMLDVIMKAKRENPNRNSQGEDTVLRCVTQYTHKPNSDNEKVMNTLILYKMTSNSTRPPLQSKINSAAIPNMIKPF